MKTPRPKRKKEYTEYILLILFADNDMPTQFQLSSGVCSTLINSNDHLNIIFNAVATFLVVLRSYKNNLAGCHVFIYNHINDVVVRL